MTKINKLKARSVRLALAKFIPDAEVRRLNLREEIDPRDIGDLLLAALAPDLPRDAQLDSLLISSGDGELRLIDALDAQAVPLWRTWIPQTFAEALALPFVFGAEGEASDSLVPAFEHVSIMDRGTGRLGGVAQLKFKTPTLWADLTAIYGDASARPPFCRYVNFDGKLLVKAGREARDAQTVH